MSFFEGLGKKNDQEPKKKGKKKEKDEKGKEKEKKERIKGGNRRILAYTGKLSNLSWGKN